MLHSTNIHSRPVKIVYWATPVTHSTLSEEGHHESGVDSKEPKRGRKKEGVPDGQSLGEWGQEGRG